MVPEAQPVKGHGILRLLCVSFRQKAYHLPPGHFGKGAFLDDFSVFLLPEYTGHKAVLRFQKRPDAPGILLGSKVQNHPVFFRNLAAEPVTPEAVQVFMAGSYELRLHFQAVGGDPVKGAQNPVEPRQDEKMLLDIVQAVLRKHAGSHVLVLDSLIGKNSGG